MSDERIYDVFYENAYINIYGVITGEKNNGKNQK
jgi:hypothetical protein